MTASSSQAISLQPALSAGLRRFPSELRSKPLSRIEPRFTMLFMGSLIFFGGIVFALSFRKVSDTASEKQILKIQERYASIVLNQPKPVEAPKVKEVKTAASGKEDAAGQKKEDVKVDREKESYSAKQERKAETQVQRQAVRAKVAQQVQSTGIFAAITAVGSGPSGALNGASSSVSDLLGAASDGIGDLGNLKVSKGTFATKNVDISEVKARRGQITSGVDIATQAVGKASGGKIVSGGSVNITSAPPEVTGEAASLASRSQASIKRQIDLEANRLKRVYENWLKRDPSLAGQLKIKFTILPSGEVANVSIVKSTTNNAEFDDNVVRYVKRWMFPAIEGGGPVEVIYPFVFEGQPS
jgi:TonB family protein